MQLLLLGCVFGEEQTGGKTLVIDVYANKTSLDSGEYELFALWARDLRGGRGSLREYPQLLHVENPLGEVFDIADETQTEANGPKFVVNGHVTPRVEQGAYKGKFSELGFPPNYSGQTSLTIRAQDRRVLTQLSRFEV